MQKITFDELKASGKLPSPKGVALAIMRLTRHEDVSREQITRTLKGDPAMSSRLIKAANTVKCGATRHIASVPDAVTVLGISAVRNIALGFYLVANHRSGACRHFDYQEFWSRSLLVAASTTLFAGPSRGAPAEEVFACGLLSRIGQLALATVYPRQYSDVLVRWATAPHAELVTLEQEEFGVNHDEVTASLLGEWGFPGALIEAVRHHRRPENGHFTDGARGHQVAGVLHVGSFFADLCLMEVGARARLVPEIFILGSRISLDQGTAAECCDQAVAEWRDWCMLIGVPSRPVESFTSYVDGTGPAPPTPPAVLAAGPDRTSVLIVDDDDTMIGVLTKLLVADGYAVNSARDGLEALAVALEKRPQIVITDWMMPRMDGISFIRALRETPTGRAAYVLMLTTMEDEENLVVAFKAGADDYLVKPIRPRVLAARLRAGERIVGFQQALTRDRDDVRRFAGELASAHRTLQETALTDALTGVPNHAYAMERLDREWAAATRHGHALSIMLIKIDFLKGNDSTGGDDAGEMALKRIVRLMLSVLRAEEVLCRIGGEEFLLIYPGADAGAVHRCAERLRATVETAQSRAGEATVVAAISGGIASRTDAVPDAACLFKAAGRALHAAKWDEHNRRGVASASEFVWADGSNLKCSA